jgi:hypothetical protein
MSTPDVAVLLKSFESPDEVRTFPKGKFELVRIGGMTIGRATYEPGWRYCEGTPLRSEIEEASPDGLPEALEIANREVERRFGTGPIDAKIQALVVEVEV